MTTAFLRTLATDRVHDLRRTARARRRRNDASDDLALARRRRAGPRLWPSRKTA